MKILFCSDGSIQAENAVRFGAHIAAACQAETAILGIAGRTGRNGAVLQALERAQGILKEHQLNAELITKTGRPVHEIIKHTRETRYDLVVIGAVRRGFRGPIWMSARANKIIESVEPPVLVVIGARSKLNRILLCTGGTKQADAAVQFTGGIAHCANASVNLLHVVAEPPPVYANLVRSEDDPANVLESNTRLGRSLRHQKQLLEEMSVPCEIHLRHGLVLDELLKELRRTEYDLVVSGSSAGYLLRTYIMGNVTREILNRSELPVLVVRGGRRRGHGLSSLIHDLLHRPSNPPAGGSGLKDLSS